MCGSVYLPILGIHHYAPNTFSALLNLPNRQILVNTICESQFSWLLVNLCKNVRECWQIFSTFSQRMDVCAVLALHVILDQHSQLSKLCQFFWREFAMTCRWQFWLFVVQYIVCMGLLDHIWIQVGKNNHYIPVNFLFDSCVTKFKLALGTYERRIVGDTLPLDKVEKLRKLCPIVHQLRKLQ